MITLVGLGNPGKKYQNNRHNVGHMLVDYLINELKNSQINELKLIKTDCFMNQSGEFIKKLIGNQKSAIKKLVIVHDDLDIPFGKFHIQKGVGPQLHNGLESIEQTLKFKDFWRIRIGIDARTPQRWINGEKYVLQNFLSEEMDQLQKILFSKILQQLKVFLKTEFSIQLENR